MKLPWTHLVFSIIKHMKPVCFCIIGTSCIFWGKLSLKFQNGANIMLQPRAVNQERADVYHHQLDCFFAAYSWKLCSLLEKNISSLAMCLNPFVIHRAGVQALIVKPRIAGTSAEISAITAAFCLTESWWQLFSQWVWELWFCAFLMLQALFLKAEISV